MADANQFSQEMGTLVERISLPRLRVAGDAFAAGDVKGALTESERVLAESPRSLDARIAWILCQLEVGSVPVAALSGPLEEVFAGLEENPELGATAAVVALRMARRLVERGQMRIALPLMERAMTLLRSSTGAFPAQAEFHGTLRKLYTEEIKRGELRREAKPYLDQLRKRLEQLEAERPAPMAPSKAPDAPRKKSYLNSKALLESAVAAERAPQTEGRAEPDLTGMSAVPPADREERSEEDIRDTSRLRHRFFLGGGAAFALMGLYFLAKISFPEAALEIANERLAIQIGASIPASLSLPEVKSIAEASAGSSAIRELSRRMESLPTRNSKGPENEVDTAALQFKGELAQPEPQDNLPRPPPRPDSRKLPEADADRLAGTVVESLGRVPDPREIDVAVGSLRAGPDGRTYGPPLNASGSDRALDGSDLRAYPVDQLAAPVLYKIIAPTKVLSAPSVLANPLGELKPEAMVQVTSRMGRWLEIQSTGGRRGFIYSQDAAEQR
ncbi:MAG: hypothetical protein IT290_12475 [Deltaproteobacteria bacterium]|nr:hypothetical protein [Deltaproteobacteria bacterium]